MSNLNEVKKTDLESIKNPVLRFLYNLGQKFTKSYFKFILFSVLAGLIVGAIVLLSIGVNPFEAYGLILSGIFGNPQNIARSIIRSAPIILTGISVAFAFRTGLFNIGVEGQFIIGALVAALSGFGLNLPPVIHGIVIIIFAVVAASLWGGFAGFLKSKFGVSEVITTIMLNWIAYYLNNFLVSLPGIKKPETGGTYEILDSAKIDILDNWKRSAEGIAWRGENADALGAKLLLADLNFAILFAITVGVLIWFVLRRTTLGHELKSVGFNSLAAEHAGINVKSSMLKSMAISGGIAGLAGALQVMGVTYKVTELSLMEGNGFDGIAVSLIGNNSPIGSIFSGLFFGSMVHGGRNLQAQLQTPSEIIRIVFGIILFFIAMPALFKVLFRIEWLSKLKKSKSIPPDESTQGTTEIDESSEKEGEDKK